MKVTYFSPLPPERTGVADYSALLLPPLRERIDVRVARRGARRPRRGTHLAVYHVGNNPDAHGWIVEALRRRRGLVVLHEFVLHHLVAGMTLGRGKADGYLDAMEREAGPVGRMLAHGVVDGLVPPLWEARPHDFPLAGEVLDFATGVIVHSHYVEERARAAGYAGPIWRIPHPAWPAVLAPPDASLTAAGSPVIGCLGHLNPEKRLPSLLESFVKLRERHARAVLVLAGAVSPEVRLESWLERHRLRRGVDVLTLGHVEEERIASLLTAFDVCVNLRFPTMGETSGSVMRALGLGRPLVVSDVGWFSELPDSAVVKIASGEAEPAELASALGRLTEDPELRARLGAAAREYVTREHDLARVADLWVAALEEAAGGASVQQSLFREVAQASEEVGLRADHPEFESVAKSVGEVARGD